MGKLAEKYLAEQGGTVEDLRRDAAISMEVHARQRKEPSGPEPVPRTPELVRVIGLPRRPDGWGEELAAEMTRWFRRPGGTMSLRPVQAACLRDAYEAGGLVAAVPVSGGKTLAALLVGLLFDDAEPILFLVKADLRDKLKQKDIPELSRHWHLAQGHVVSYSELSSPKQTDLLERLRPGLIVADEVHCLRQRASARTRRFLRYMTKVNPSCRLVGLSGSITKASVRDYAHLAALALRGGAPVPRDWPTVKAVAEALDEGRQQNRPPGPLLELCSPAELAAVEAVPSLDRDGRAAAETLAARLGWQRRLRETPGWVSAPHSGADMSLTLRGRRPPLPPALSRVLERAREAWRVGDEEAESALDAARMLRQLASGFYYVWDWPGGEPDLEWVEARAAFRRAVAGRLRHGSGPGMDSPLLLYNAAARHYGELKGDGPRWACEEWPAWRAVKDRYRPPPPTVPVWVDKYLVDDAVRWGWEVGKLPGGGIIWYEHDCLGREVASLGGFPLYAGGDDSKRILSASPREQPVIVASIKAHGEGKNLQAYCRSLVTTPPAGGQQWEQLIGRTHRTGQEADEVEVHVYLHTPEFMGALEQATREETYVEQTQGQQRKLLIAERIEA